MLVLIFSVQIEHKLLTIDLAVLNSIGFLSFDGHGFTSNKIWKRYFCDILKTYRIIRICWFCRRLEQRLNGSMLLFRTNPRKNEWNMARNNYNKTRYFYNFVHLLYMCIIKRVLCSNFVRDAPQRNTLPLWHYNCAVIYLF